MSLWCLLNAKTRREKISWNASEGGRNKRIWALSSDQHAIGSTRIHKYKIFFSFYCTFPFFRAFVWQRSLAAQVHYCVQNSILFSFMRMIMIACEKVLLLRIKITKKEMRRQERSEWNVAMLGESTTHFFPFVLTLCLYLCLSMLCHFFYLHIPNSHRAHHRVEVGKKEEYMKWNEPKSTHLCVRACVCISLT